jgi:hypothetical protein
MGLRFFEHTADEKSVQTGSMPRPTPAYYSMGTDRILFPMTKRPGREKIRTAYLSKI